MTALVGVDTGQWSLRELCWAVDAKRREEWDRLSYGLFWLVNSMPNFSKHRRPMVPLSKIHPMMSSRHRSGLTDDQIEAVLDRWAARAENKQ